MREHKRIDVRDIGTEYGDVVSVATLAKILGLKSCKTIYLWIAQGRLDGCCRRRGKHYLIIREFALDRILNGPSWTEK